MDEKKDFKMIVLRGLDEDEGTASIIQKAMKDYDIKTGQKAIVKIIERFDYLEKENERQRNVIRDKVTEIKGLENKLYIVNQVLKNLKSVFNFVETL